MKFSITFNKVAENQIKLQNQTHLASFQINLIKVSFFNKMVISLDLMSVNVINFVFCFVYKIENNFRSGGTVIGFSVLL